MKGNRLHLNVENSRISGVCSGLAKWLDLDPSLVRIVFFFGAFLTHGLMLLVYIALLVILDEELEDTKHNTT